MCVVNTCSTAFAFVAILSVRPGDTNHILNVVLPPAPFPKPEGVAQSVMGTLVAHWATPHCLISSQQQPGARL